MKKIRHLLLALFAFSCYLPQGMTQTSSDNLELWYIQTNDKNKFVGSVLENKRRTILLETESLGAIEIKKSRIKYYEIYDPEQRIEGIYWPKYKFPHHNVFTPSGHIGKSYYKNTFVYLNTFNFKYNDRIALGLGIIPVIRSESEGFYFWFSPKVAIPVKSKQIAVSVGYYGAIASLTESVFSDEQGDRKVGVLYGVGTYENERFSTSLGLGYGMHNGRFLKWPFYVVNIQCRVRDRKFLHFEILGGDIFSSFSVISIRNQGKKNTFDLGWLLPVNHDRYSAGTFGGPFFSVLFPFGKKKL